jgi:hypothetical protein
MREGFFRKCASWEIYISSLLNFLRRQNYERWGARIYNWIVTVLWKTMISTWFTIKNASPARVVSECLRQASRAHHPCQHTRRESSLEITAKAQGFEVVFLPKFHCELNFIEQCWGHAKRVYRQYPSSSKEEDLERNLLSALESVPMETMRR